MTYSRGFKARMVQRLTGPDRASATWLAGEVGVSQSTLSRWVREAGTRAKNGGKRMQSQLQERESRSVRPDDLPAAEKLRLVTEAAGLPHEELGAFLRRNGLHEAQLEEWRRKVEEALQRPKKRRRGPSPEARRIRELERELSRKDRALAEVTALLALKKKLETLLGDEDDDTRPRSAR